MTMTKKTPRGPVPSLIGGTNGRPRRATVKKLSHCYRCEDDLVAGQDCVEIPQLGTGFASARRVCEACFQAIIAKTTEDLAELRSL